MYNYVKKTKKHVIRFVVGFCVTNLLVVVTAKADTYCVAHRANGYGHIENSLAAVTTATQNNASGIEIDIRYTKDRKSLVYHDKELERFVIGEHCPKGNKFSSLTHESIKQNCRLSDGQELPELEDVLSVVAASNSKLFIEIKAKYISLEDLNKVKQYFYHSPDRVFFISFEPKVLNQIKKHREQDPYFESTKVILVKSNASRVPVDKYDGVDAKKIRSSKVQEFKQAGKIVGVYTKNSERSIKQEIDKGVAFITTDNMELCEVLVGAAG